jgi:hypothetical protein
MKNLKFITMIFLAAAFVTLSMTSHADNQNKPKPYPLKTCLVCDMKLGEMGELCVFAYKGQAIKVCNKSEKRTSTKTRTNT